MKQFELQSLLNDNKGRVTAGMIKGVLIGLIFLMVLMNMLPDIMNSTQTAINSTAAEFTNNPNLYGTEAAAIGDDLADYSGYFWVVGLFVLIVGTVLAVFSFKRR